MLSMYLSIYLIYVSICLENYLPIYLRVSQSIELSINLYLSTDRPSVHVFLFLFPLCFLPFVVFSLPLLLCILTIHRSLALSDCMGNIFFLFFVARVVIRLDLPDLHPADDFAKSDDKDKQ